MALDGFFIKNLITEIKEELLFGRLEKIEQISKDIFIFNFYIRKEKKYLYFKLNSPFSSTFLGPKNENKDYTQTNLLQQLKKNIEGYILKDIYQYKLDRVIIFRFSGNDLLEGTINKDLILELMGRYNNLVLVKDEIIIDAYQKSITNSNRSLVPKAAFKFFRNDKALLDSSAKALSETDFSTRFMGISKDLSKYLYETSENVFDIKINPTIDFNSKKLYWFDIFNNSKKKKYFNTLSEALSYFVFVPISNYQKYENFLSNLLIHNTKKLDNQRNDLSQLKENLNYRVYGDKIYEYSVDLSKKVHELEIDDGNTITLNPLKTLNENAQLFYKQYQKAKRGIEFISAKIKETILLIDYINDIKYDLSTNSILSTELDSLLRPLGYKVKQEKIKTKKTLNIPSILTIDINNAKFYIGKNSIQNEYITSTLAKHNDYWFHAKDVPGSHVLLKGTPSDENISLAAMFAIYYSKLKNQLSGDVTYKEAKHVKRISGIVGYKVTIRDPKTLYVKVKLDLIESLLTANKLK